MVGKGIGRCIGGRALGRAGALRRVRPGAGIPPESWADRVPGCVRALPPGWIVRGAPIVGRMQTGGAGFPPRARAGADQRTE
jgi:hypothetical protein